MPTDCPFVPLTNRAFPRSNFYPRCHSEHPPATASRSRVHGFLGDADPSVEWLGGGGRASPEVVKLPPRSVPLPLYGHGEFPALQPGPASPHG